MKTPIKNYSMWNNGHLPELIQNVFLADKAFFEQM